MCLWALLLSEAALIRQAVVLYTWQSNIVVPDGNLHGFSDGSLHGLHLHDIWRLSVAPMKFAECDVVTYMHHVF